LPGNARVSSGRTGGPSLTIPLDSIPQFTAAQALAAAQEEYGIVGAIASLPSERDQNFLLAEASGAMFVLKIANLHDSADVLDFQNQAMLRVANSAAACQVPKALRSRQGLEIERIHQAAAGTDYWMRLLTWIDGTVLAKAGARDAAMLESIGAGMAKFRAQPGAQSRRSVPGGERGAGLGVVGYAGARGSAGGWLADPILNGQFSSEAAAPAPASAERRRIGRCAAGPRAP
jgi:hypothetical protein